MRRNRMVARCGERRTRTTRQMASAGVVYIERMRVRRREVRRLLNRMYNARTGACWRRCQANNEWQITGEPPLRVSVAAARRAVAAGGVGVPAVWGR